MDPAQTKNVRINDTMWHVHRRMVTGTMILSILLLYVLAVTVYSNLSNAKMFSFGWSNRIIENPGRDEVASLYRDNKDTSNPKLDSMLKSAMGAAMCRPVLFSGGLQWEENQVPFLLQLSVWGVIFHLLKKFSIDIEGSLVHRSPPHATASETRTSST